MLRRKRFWLGLTIALAFLGIFLARTDFGEIRAAFAQADYILALASVPLYFVGFWIRTVRWRFLLRPVNDVSTRRLYPVVLIGLMTNNIAPARVGELVRAYLLGERESMSKPAALGTIAVDRAFDGLTLLAILGIVTAVSGASSQIGTIGVWTAILATFVFLAAATVLTALAVSARARVLLAKLITFLPVRFAIKVADIVDAFMTGLVAIRSPLVLGSAALLSVASWMVEAVMYYIVGVAFDLGISFHVYLLILAGLNLALSILQTPGGLGPFEATAQHILLSFGVDSGLAGAYTIALHALLLAPVVMIGLLVLWSTQMSLGQLLGVPKTAPAGSEPGGTLAVPPRLE